MNLSLLPEIILLSAMTVIGALVALRRPFALVAGKTTFYLALLGAALAALFMPVSVGDGLLGMGLANQDSLFLWPRAATIFVGIFLGQLAITSNRIPDGRKLEALLLITGIVFCCELLLGSRNILLTYFLIIVMELQSLFLMGLGYNDRAEGEALLKSWVQFVLLSVSAFGGGFVLILFAGSAGYDAINAFAMASDQSVLARFGLLCATFLPVLLAAGFFPFHFLKVDSDQGAGWPVFSVQALLCRGVTAVVLWKLTILVFAKQASGGAALGAELGILGGIALLSGLWAAVGAASQRNIARFFSSFIQAQWGFLVAAGALAVEPVASTFSYTFTAMLLWNALMCLVLGKVFEQAKNGTMDEVAGMGMQSRRVGILLLFALSSILLVPPFPGISALFYLYAANLPHQSLSYLFFLSLLFCMIYFMATKVVSAFVFGGHRGVAVNSALKSPYDKIELCMMLCAIAILLCFGASAHDLNQHLLEPAKLFINP